MPDDIFSEEDGEVIEVGGDRPPQQAQPTQRAAPSGPPPVLRAEWDPQGRCWVALFQGDQPLEKWRPPTKEEWDALKVRGVLTRPSPVAPVGAAPAAAPEPSLLDRVKSNALPFAAGVGLTLFGIKVVMPMLAARSNPAPAPVPEGAEDVEDSGEYSAEDAAEDVDEEAVG